MPEDEEVPRPMQSTTTSSQQYNNNKKYTVEQKIPLQPKLGEAGKREQNPGLILTTLHRSVTLSHLTIKSKRLIESLESFDNPIARKFRTRAGLDLSSSLAAIAQRAVCKSCFLPSFLLLCTGSLL